MIYSGAIETEIGTMLAAATGDGICLLDFAGSRIAPEQRYLEKRFRTNMSQEENNHIEKLRTELKEYFSGTLKVFTVPLIISGTPFQQLVWKELLRIPFGVTKSYLEQAAACGLSGSVRAVARANSSNRIAIVIPCHRVIGSDGSLTGYGGGLYRKKWLLDHEKRHSGKPADQQLF
jgi:AraC family transcriptional regulator of adaptative response/methylated-DNA-[protein]-cysteine methyltransferase